MRHEIINNSLVIVGNSHNPSLLSDFFLIKSGIIKDEKEIDRTSSVITPALSKIGLTNGTSINLISNQLAITGKSGSEVFEMGQKYCINLPYIKSFAFGINFLYKISEFEVAKWLNKSRADGFPQDASVQQVVYRILIREHLNCTIHCTLQAPNSEILNLNFNFQYDYKEQTLGEMKNDFVAESEEHRLFTENFISKTFKLI